MLLHYRFSSVCELAEGRKSLLVLRRAPLKFLTADVVMRPGNSPKGGMTYGGNVCTAID